MTTSERGVLFVGALTLDTLYKVDDFSQGAGKYLATDVITTASGMATAAATAAARLGGQASLWASVGDDATGHALIAEISAEGVDCTPVRYVASGRSASAAIVVDRSGERWVVVDYDPVTQAPPAIKSMPPVENYAAVMADVRWPGAAKLALMAARSAGRYAILDADVATLEQLDELARCATHVVASHQGATVLSGSTDPRWAATDIAARYNCFVCITQGESGCVWTMPNSPAVFHVSSPVVNVLDTNGAGDVFHGAFSQALVEGLPITEVIHFASAAAALKCTVLGGRLGAPDRQSTLQLMNATYCN